jgi:hypothetical protein
MEQQNHILAGRPDLRAEFEDILVHTTEKKIEALKPKEVLALRIGKKDVVYPSLFGPFPGALKSFVSGNGSFNGSTISTLVADPLLSSLTDEIIAFYRKNLFEIVEGLFEMKAEDLSMEVRSAMKNKVEEEFINKAFKSSVVEVLNNSVGDIIKSTFIAVGTTLLATIGAAFIWGTNAGALTFGIGAAVAAAVILRQAIIFKEKFKNRLSLQIRNSSNQVYDDLNRRLYIFLKNSGLF